MATENGQEHPRAGHLALKLAAKPPACRETQGGPIYPWQPVIWNNWLLGFEVKQWNQARVYSANITHVGRSGGNCGGRCADKRIRLDG